MMFANPNICFIWDERLREWRHTTADRIISGLMDNYQSVKAKNNCPDIIPNMPTECAPDNRRPEKICGTCRYFNPEFPVNGKPAPVCLAIKEMKGGTEYTNPRGTQHYFRCSNGRYENGIGQ